MRLLVTRAETFDRFVLHFVFDDRTIVDTVVDGRCFLDISGIPQLPYFSSGRFVRRERWTLAPGALAPAPEVS